MEDRLIRIVAASFIIYSICLTPVFVLLLVQHTTATTGLSIQHTPVEHTIAGSRVWIQAVVEGGTGDSNATLRYRLRTTDDWRVVQMLPTVGGGQIYMGEIPNAEVTEYLYSIDYQVCSRDGSNRSICTEVYTIMVADFHFGASLPSILYPNQTYSIDIAVESWNGFDAPIDLSLSGLTTQKITATFEPSHVTPNSVTKLNLRIQESAPAGEYYLTVTGKSGTITRWFAWTFSIADFRLVVAPPSVTLSRGDRATFDMKLNSIYGFDSDVRIYLKGFPKGSSYELTATQLHLNGISILALSMETTSSVEKGTYFVIASVIGGGRVNEFTITVVIT